MLSSTWPLLLNVMLSSPTQIPVGASHEYTTIVDAIAFAQDENNPEGYVIKLAAQTHTLAGGSSVNLLNFTGPVSISSLDPDSPAVIEGNGTMPCISATGTSLSISHLTIHNGFGQSNGGCFNVSGGSLSLETVNVHSCASLGRGGAIYADGVDSVSLIGCQFTACTSSDGGAVYLSGSPAVIENTIFSNCSSDENGGAVYLSDSPTDFETTTFSNCSTGSSGKGGAIFQDYLSLTELESCSFQDCEARFGGGAYLQTDANLTDCSFQSCAAVGMTAGAICQSGGSSQTTLNCTNCSFSACKADKSGGALSLNNVDCTLKFCSFDGCTAGVDSDLASGGAATVFGGSLEVDSCLIQNCTSTYGAAGLRVSTGTEPTLLELVVSETEFTANSCADGFAAHLHIETWGADIGSIHATITECKFESGSSSYGGALSLMCNPGQALVTVDRCSFRNNHTPNTAPECIALHGSNPDPVTLTNSTACDHAAGQEISDAVIDAGNNTLGNWCCPGDVDADEDVDADDVTALLEAWGSESDGDDREDADRDGAVVMHDLIAVLLNWGACG
ncbi:MAG: right-handed parallel beta-helix repeat-containing protein [Phycisphaerales bacterium]|nr:right-handed parallel beta-helix repeat-containing protein [Phycisphaerales bacterium]